MQKVPYARDDRNVQTESQQQRGAGDSRQNHSGNGKRTADENVNGAGHRQRGGGDREMRHAQKHHGGNARKTGNQMQGTEAFQRFLFLGENDGDRRRHQPEEE